MKYRAYAAEFIGTFFLTLVVFLGASGAGHFQVPTAVLAGLTLGLMVYVFGGISGTHINPAVTLGLASVRKISPTDAALYIVAQCAGAYVASLLGLQFAGAAMFASPANTLMTGAAEALGAAVIVLGVSSVVWKKVPDAAAGLTIGTALTLGAHIASLQSNGILNPAVALGLGSISVAYVVGPILGGIVAAWGYRALARG